MKNLKVASAIFALFLAQSLLATTISEMMSGDKTASWDFIQKSGGLKLGATEKLAEKKYKINFECDISGIRKVTALPVQTNPGIIIRQFLHRRTSGKIYVSIIYGKPLAKNKKDTRAFGSPVCPALELSDIETGDYKVYFDDQIGPYLLGAIELK
jgi:hypothetical protein